MLPNKIKAEFPFFETHPELIYFDSAATSLMPKAVVTAENNFQLSHGGSPFRGNSQLSLEKNDLYHEAKTSVASFFGAKEEEFLLANNTTQAINFLVWSWGQFNLKKDDQIILSVAEHHSNLVPWQVWAKNCEAEIKWLSIDKESGELDLSQLHEWLKNEKVKLVALNQVSNVTGATNPVDEVAKMIKHENKASQKKIRLLIDGAQGALWQMDNFDQSGIDFYAFSGHKMFANTNSGGLLVKKELLDQGEFQPALYGGGMVSEVDFQKSTWTEDLSRRYQAGTPNLVGLISLRTAVDFIKSAQALGLEKSIPELSRQTKDAILDLPGFSLLCPTTKSNNILTFQHEAYNLSDIANYLDLHQIIVRVGQHCAQPLYQYLTGHKDGMGLRLSFNIYNDQHEMEYLIEVLKKMPDHLCYNGR